MGFVQVVNKGELEKGRHQSNGFVLQWQIKETYQTGNKIVFLWSHCCHNETERGLARAQKVPKERTMDLKCTRPNFSLAALPKWRALYERTDTPKNTHNLGWKNSFTHVVEVLPDQNGMDAPGFTHNSLSNTSTSSYRSRNRPQYC